MKGVPNSATAPQEYILLDISDRERENYFIAYARQHNGKIDEPKGKKDGHWVDPAIKLFLS